MKQICIFYFIAIILIVGCTDNDEILYDTTISNKFQIETSVSLQNMETLVNAFSQKGKTRATKTDVSYKIQPYVDSENDTLMYVVQCDTGGWTVYAADKRVPAILAQSENGDYSQFMEIEAIKKWTDDMAAEMKIIKHCSDEELNIPILEQKTNVDFWNSFCNPTLFVKEKTSTRVVIPDFTVGHYELYSTAQETESYEFINHLISTNWQQENGYNLYCPYLSEFDMRHAAAGCVPIAAAQVLYYLHYHLGIPEKAPSIASVTGYCHPKTYNMLQYGDTTTIWDYMNTDPSYAAPLIAHIGTLIEARYDTITASNPSYLRGLVFHSYGIDCDGIYSFDTCALVSNIRNRIPVIINASDENNTISGHSFIIDGYKSYRKVVTNVYEWVYDSHPSGVILPYVPPMRQIVYSGPVQYAVTMNWGWGPSFNTAWFALMGDWMPDATSSENYIRSRNILCNFRNYSTTEE